MYKFSTLLLFSIAALVLMAFGLSYLSKTPSGNLTGYVGGNYLVPASRLSSASVTCGGSLSGATTSVWSTTTPTSSPTGAYQRIIVTNTGKGVAYLAFGTNNATNTSGFIINTAATSSFTSEKDITDPNLIGRGANCVADVTTTLNVFKY